jgi:hypothetical protein
MDWQAMGLRLAPLLTALFGVGAIISVVTLYQMRRTARSTSFGYVREQSASWAKRLLILSVVLVILSGASGALWIISARQPDLLPAPLPTATSTLLPTPTPRTPTVTFTPTGTPTAAPTPTATPTPDPADASVPSVMRTPLPALAATPGADASLVDVQLAASERDNQPVNPGTRFPSGTERVYAFLTLDGMARNVPWAHVWYGEVDGQMREVWAVRELWPYDSPRGFTWRYLNCRDGRYELHIYIGGKLQHKVPFAVGGE